jgi:hypothetical protein
MTNSELNAADAISKLTNNYYFKQLEDFDLKNKYYKLVFYGDTLTDSSGLDASDIRKDPMYRSWALANNATNFMTVIKNGIETPVYANVVADNIRSLSNEIMDAKKKDRLDSARAYLIDFGIYYGAVVYFGKQFVLEKLYDDATIMSNLDYIHNTLCPDCVSEGIKHLSDYYGISQTAMRKKKQAVYLLNASFSTKEFRDKYKETKDNYFASVKEVLDILRKHPSLQLCVNSVDIGDTIITNNSDSSFTYTNQIQQTITCIQSNSTDASQPSETPDQKTEEKKETETEQQDSTQDLGNNEPEPEEETPTNKDKDKQKDNNEEEDKAKKTLIIAGVTVGVAVVVIIFVLIIVFAMKRNQNVNQQNVGHQIPNPYGIPSVMPSVMPNPYGLQSAYKPAYQPVYY